jgi:hypothetical protein
MNKLKASVGVSMYGKPPTLPELAKWFKHS